MGGRLFWSLCIGLFTLLLFLLWYSYPGWIDEVSPKGSITYNAIPELASLIVEVAVVAGIITALNERRWRGARESIVWHVGSDTRNIHLKLLEFEPYWAEGEKIPSSRILARHYRLLVESVGSTELQDRMHFLGGAFTPELAEAVADYVAAKTALASCLGDLDPPDFVRLVIEANDESDTAKELHETYSDDQLMSAYWACEHFQTILVETRRKLKIVEEDPETQKNFDEVAERMTAASALAEAYEMSENNEE